MNVLFFGALGFTLFCTLLLALIPLLAFLRPKPELQRMLEVVATDRTDRRSVRRGELFEDGLLAVASSMRNRLGLKLSVKSEEKLLSAGLRSPVAGELFFASQLLTPIIGAFGGSFIAENTFFWVFALAAVGYLAPNLWLTEKIRRRRERIRRALPDAADLLVICVDAGLGLDQAMLRVADELALSYPDIQEELTRVLQEQRAGVPRIETLQNLAIRTSIPEIASFVSMLTQTERFGTPILKALASFSADLRQKRRQKAEEAAAKTKIKILFPLVFCIFPCLFIVLLTPALLGLTESMKEIGK